MRQLNFSMTWNEYLDLVRYNIERRLSGICGANTAALYKSQRHVYYSRLDSCLYEYARKNNIIVWSYYWPIADRQSRIDFLESLKFK